MKFAVILAAIGTLAVSQAEHVKHQFGRGSGHGGRGHRNGSATEAWGHWRNHTEGGKWRNHTNWEGRNHTIDWGKWRNHTNWEGRNHTGDCDKFRNHTNWNGHRNQSESHLPFFNQTGEQQQNLWGRHNRHHFGNGTHDKRNHTKPHYTFLSQEVSAWPEVVTPLNFELEINAYNLDPVTHELTRNFELGDLQYVDSDHNQQMNVQLKTINGRRSEIFNYIDFTNNYYTSSIPDLNICVQKELPADFHIDLKQRILDIQDPLNNFTVYKGITSLTFANGTFHFFTLTQTDQLTGKDVVQNLFFDVSTQRLKYVTVDGHDLVFESTLGFQARTYTNDFDPFRTCPEATSIENVHHRQALQEHLPVGFMANQFLA